MYYSIALVWFHPCLFPYILQLLSAPNSFMGKKIYIYSFIHSLYASGTKLCNVKIGNSASLPNGTVNFKLKPVHYNVRELVNQCDEVFS